MTKKLLTVVFVLVFSGVYSQGSPDYSSGIKININEDGSRYIRFITWAQMWVQYNDNVPDEQKPLEFSTRRARILTYSQITPKFLILAHFGLNSLNADNMSTVGKGESSQIFFHDVWVQYNVVKGLDIGAGLHYWNGISRLNNQSTLNIMTLDNNRQSWATLGLTDQFARHQGVYFKGGFDKFQYRVAINESLTNTLDSRDITENPGVSLYQGRKLLGSKDAGLNYTGYFEYSIFETESNFLPFKVGTYMGTKKILNIGAGFFVHPKGSVTLDGSELKGENVSIFAVDAFYDAPLGENKGAITAYAVFQSNNYGKNYMYSAYGTGTMLYAHAGYLIPTEKLTKFQPYVSYGNHSYEAVDDNRSVLGVGANVFLNGHHSKLALEYKNEQFGETDSNTVTLQAMIYL